MTNPPHSKLFVGSLTAVAVAGVIVGAVWMTRPRTWAPRDGGVDLIGVAALPGTASDRSGLTGLLAGDVPADRLGGLGSAIAWSGGHHFVAVPDCGPADGEAVFVCRYHALTIMVDPASRPAVTVSVDATTVLRNEAGDPFVGRSSAFVTGDPGASLRRDMEGVRVGANGSIYVSDEYGPCVTEFAPDGRRVRELPVPAAFGIAHQSAHKREELGKNTSGRLAGRGFESLAISPDGTRLFALMQSPLIQDGGLASVNCRLLEITLATGTTRQFVVPLAGPHLNFNDLVAINDRAFLAIERDTHVGRKAKVKAIVRLDLGDATDISAMAALPVDGLPAAVVRVARRPFLDLLGGHYAAAGDASPDKIEGLAFGPDLPDGRHVLIISTDNDFKPDEPTWFWAFAVDRKALPDFVPQQLVE